MLIEASESSILCASLSLCQTLFTFSGGISHREGWWIDLNSRQRGLCGRKMQTETDRERRMGDRLRELDADAELQQIHLTHLQIPSHLLISVTSQHRWYIRRHAGLWYHLIGPWRRKNYVLTTTDQFRKIDISDLLLYVVYRNTKKTHRGTWFYLNSSKSVVRRIQHSVRRVAFWGRIVFILWAKSLILAIVTEEI